jgi:hypothetical protein
VRVERVVAADWCFKKMKIFYFSKSFGEIIKKNAFLVFWRTLKGLVFILRLYRCAKLSVRFLKIYSLNYFFVCVFPIVVWCSEWDELVSHSFVCSSQLVFDIKLVFLSFWWKWRNHSPPTPAKQKRYTCNVTARIIFELWIDNWMEHVFYFIYLISVLTYLMWSQSNRLNRLRA